jgi:ArsR family transcriptional regulator
MATRQKPAVCCELLAIRPLPDVASRQVVAAMKALADPTRLEILRYVCAQTGPVCACDIVSRFDLSQPTISHHLKTLRAGGLVTGKRHGLWTFYAPDRQGLRLLADLGRVIGID